MIEIYGITIVPIIIGIVEVAKTAGMPKKYSPFLALLIGVGAGMIYMDPENMKRGILLGVAAGLSAVGLYSGTKNVLLKQKKDKNRKDVEDDQDSD